MRVRLLGDAHGRWSDIAYLMLRSEADVYIQIGDMGIGFGIDKYLPVFPKPLLFIDGNHDNHVLLRELVMRGDFRASNNAWYIPRGSTLKLGNTRFNCLGGAQSIDKHIRVDGRDWWPEEIPSYTEYDKFATLPKADVFLTHTAPMRVLQALGWETQDPVSHVLDRVLDLSPRPSRWFFGHWHRARTVILDGTAFTCLGTVHDHEEPAFPGVTIEV